MPDAATWNRLYETAAAQAGYLTIEDATSAGYSRPLVHHYVTRGRLEHVRRGIYRLVHFPEGEHEDLVVLWLWSRKAGAFSHDTALSLHELSDALPARRHMILPEVWRRRRLRVPANVSLHFAAVAASDRAWVGSVPVTKPLRTIIDCAEAHVAPELVEQAVAQALARGLFAPTELERAVRTRGLPLRRRGGRGPWQIVPTTHRPPSRRPSKPASGRPRRRAARA